jgi:glycine betaine/proline transport system ATP-binding protein
MKLGNTIAILEGGRIVQAGTAEDILLHPANAYVAEFVKHVNPLNVLRGHAVMKPMASLLIDAGEVVLDVSGRIRVRLDGDGRPVGVMLDGNVGRLTNCPHDGDMPAANPTDILVAPVDLKLKAAIGLKRQTGHPIMLVDQLGRLAGLCGDEEIYNSLLRRGAES